MKIDTDSKEFDEIVGAILNGKFSWACLLLLRLAGRNPENYFTSSTYARLVNSNAPKQKKPKKPKSPASGRA